MALWTITANYSREFSDGSERSGQVTTFMVDAFSVDEAHTKAVYLLTTTSEDKGHAVTLFMDVRLTFPEVIEGWLKSNRDA